MHSAIATSPQHAREKTSLIAVIGNPNCGKTTLFNRLTGLRQKVGNYPGVTVEKREGTLTHATDVRLLDLPGTYSLAARSPDEKIARDVLLGHVPGTSKPDAVIIVIDATNLERNLYLAAQIIELGLPVVIACNMMDMLEKAGMKLDTAELGRQLGVPVVATVASTGQGMDKLNQLLPGLCDQGQSAAVNRPWKADEKVEEEIATITTLMQSTGLANDALADGLAVLLLNGEELHKENELPEEVRSTLAAARNRLERDHQVDPSLDLTASRYAWLSKVSARCLEQVCVREFRWTEYLDRVFTHRVWGLFFFAALMGAMFYSIFVLADPLMGLIDTGIGELQQLVARVMPDGVLQNLLVDGVLAGVGAVVIFLPQICILFAFLALLEDTGYMARAAFVMDRIMRKVGLPGKSFIPLLSCHACAIPGIMAARTIENHRDRLTTILVAPLMTCSARLPVYTVLIAACLPGSAWMKATVLVGLYAFGIFTALVMATIFKKTILAGPPSHFLIELPPYRSPRVVSILRVMWERSSLFLSRAGTVILAITILLWALMNYPKDDATQQWYQDKMATLQTQEAPTEAMHDLEAAYSSKILRNSVAGRLGRFIEPAIEPLGYNWKIGVGIVASFAAREVFVSTMGVVYSVGAADEEASTLKGKIARARWPDGRKVFTPLTAVSLLIFYALACQCASTIAVVRRETNSWRWPVFMFGYMSVLAYVVSLVVYQAGSAMGVGLG
jgi:ferrous iron transport protein B